jgi:hypothetical protein
MGTFVHHSWRIASPAAIVKSSTRFAPEKSVNVSTPEQVYEKVGGFGHLLRLVYDWQPRQKMLTS